jgi:hypothetical protein
VKAIQRAVRTLVDLMTGLFARFFPQPSFSAWVLCCAAMAGLTQGLSPADEAFIRACLGYADTDPLPTERATREVLVVGRRGGKSRYAAFRGVVAACFRDYRQILASGERGVVMIVSPDRKQSRVIFRYISALIDETPMLAAMVVGRTKDSIDLSNNVSIEVATASFKTTRGYTIVCAIVDECAFLPTDDSAEPDAELIAAILPATSTVPGAELILISSPYARKGELWRAYQTHFGKPGAPVRVWKASTRQMNPSVPQSFIDRAYADDPASAAAEFGAEFRTDIEQLFTPEVIAACRMLGRHELPPRRGVRYRAFVDPSGGSSDSFTMCVAHVEGGRILIDLLFEAKAPFDPDHVVKAMVEVLKRYGITTVRGDKYAGEWPRQSFSKQGVSYRVTDYTKSEMYQALIPRMNARTIELLDDERSIRQLLQLERRTARGGKDSIDHPSGAKDDLANAIAGVAHKLRDGQTAIALISVGEVESHREHLRRCAAADAERIRKGEQDQFLWQQCASKPVDWRDAAFERSSRRRFR